MAREASDAVTLGDAVAVVGAGVSGYEVKARRDGGGGGGGACCWRRRGRGGGGGSDGREEDVFDG